MEIEFRPIRADKYDIKKAVVIKKKIPMNAEVITLDEGDDTYIIRGYSLGLPDHGVFKFVVIEWRHPNTTLFADACFFYKSLHMRDWEVKPIVVWTNKYYTKDDFLKDFPMFAKLF